MAGNGWSLAGKVAVITGATSGLGRVAAEALAQGGARLFLVCRDDARGRRTAQQIAADTGNREVEVLVGDLSSQPTVRAVASAFLARGEPLHILLNNAGSIFGFRRQVSPDGFELTFALNHLAYYTLTLCLLDPRRGRSRSSPGMADVSGKHYSGTQEARLRPEACNDEDALRLWELSARLTGLPGPEPRLAAAAEQGSTR